jgi:hypothetical protein
MRSIAACTDPRPVHRGALRAYRPRGEGVTTDEERIALLIDYENLAIGAREDLRTTFDLGPVSDALAERGRVVVRKAYADWSYFDDDRRMLTRHHVELIEIPWYKDRFPRHGTNPF